MSSTDRSITIVKPSWQSLVHGWLTEVRSACGLTARPAAPFPLARAASVLGVRVTTAPLSPTLWGLTWNADEVTINSQLSEREQRFAFAHELAHVGQARGYMIDGPRVGEWIADWFARELLAPLRQVARHLSGGNVVHHHGLVQRLVENLQVPESTVLLQAALLGAAPRMWTYNGRVLCCRCGDRTPLPGCPCLTFSESNAPNPHFDERNQDQGISPKVSYRGTQPEGRTPLISTLAGVFEPDSASLIRDEALLQGLRRPSAYTGGKLLSLPRPHALIRPFESSDVSELVRLLSVLPELYPGGDQWLQRRLAACLAGQASCIVVEDYMTHSLCAAAIVTPKSSRCLKLSTFYVAQEYRLQGIGTLLLRTLIRTWQQQSLSEVYVTVAHHVEPEFRSLFKPAGFNRISLEKDRYGPGRHEAVWKRQWDTYSRSPVLDSSAACQQNLQFGKALGIPTCLS